MSEPEGDCYEAAVMLITNLSERGRNPVVCANLRLVHAEVEGQGPIAGVRFGHAFVLMLDCDTVLDFSNGNAVVMQREKYYRLGKIDEINNIRMYDYAEAAAMMVQFEHFGPWDLVTSTGL